MTLSDAYLQGADFNSLLIFSSTGVINESLFNFFKKEKEKLPVAQGRKDEDYDPDDPVWEKPYWKKTLDGLKDKGFDEKHIDQYKRSIWKMVDVIDSMKQLA